MSVRAIYPQEASLTSIAVHDFNALSNIDIYDSLRPYDAWLQQEFAEGKFSVRIGQLLADAEFFDSDNSDPTLKDKHDTRFSCLRAPRWSRAFGCVQF